MRAAGQRFNVADTANLLTGVLGPGVSTMGKALTSRLGFDVRPLMASATPALLALIGRTAKDQHLTSVDIARMLQAERSAVVASGSPDVKAMVDEAFRLGDKAERLRAMFSDDEWKKIRLSPMAVTFYVVSASPSGVSGLTKEVVAAGRTMQALVKGALPVSLGREVAAASKEGGFLGIGGTRVSAEEEHALAEVAAAVS